MIKVGDKIEIKKKESTLKETFLGICEALRSDRLSEKDKLDWCESAINVLEMWYNQEELESVGVAKKRLIPILHNLVSKGSINSMASFLIIIGKFILFVREEILNVLSIIWSGINLRKYLLIGVKY